LDRSATVILGAPATVRQVPVSFELASLYSVSEPVAFTPVVDGAVVVADADGVPDADAVLLAEGVSLGDVDGVASDGIGTADTVGSRAGGVLAHPVSAMPTPATVAIAPRRHRLRAGAPLSPITLFMLDPAGPVGAATRWRPRIRGASADREHGHSGESEAVRFGILWRHGSSRQVVLIAAQIPDR
jgi:hypothetical protein